MEMFALLIFFIFSFVASSQTSEVQVNSVETLQDAKSLENISNKIFWVRVHSDEEVDELQSVQLLDPGECVECAIHEEINSKLQREIYQKNSIIDQQNSCVEEITQICQQQQESLINVQPCSHCVNCDSSERKLSELRETCKQKVDLKNKVITGLKKELEDTQKQLKQKEDHNQRLMAEGDWLKRICCCCCFFR